MEELLKSSYSILERYLNKEKSSLIYNNRGIDTKKEGVVVAVVVLALVFGLFISTNGFDIDVISGMVSGNVSLQDDSECIVISEGEVVTTQRMRLIKDSLETKLFMVTDIPKNSTKYPSVVVWRGSGVPPPSLLTGSIENTDGLLRMREFLMGLARYYWNINRPEPMPYSAAPNELFNQAFGKDEWTNPNPICVKEIDLEELEKTISQLKWIFIINSSGVAFFNTSGILSIPSQSLIISEGSGQKYGGGTYSGRSTSLDEAWMQTMSSYTNAPYLGWNNYNFLAYDIGYGMFFNGDYLTNRSSAKAKAYFDFSKMPFEIKSAKAYFKESTYLYNWGSRECTTVLSNPKVNLTGDIQELVSLDSPHTIADITVPNAEGQFEITPVAEHDVKPNIVGSGKTCVKGFSSGLLGIFVSPYRHENNPPVAIFNASKTTAEIFETIDFDASGSYDLDGNIISYSWNFGDENTASGVTISHAYGNPSTYSVSLTVTDNDGATDSDSLALTIRGHGGGSGQLPQTKDLIVESASFSPPSVLEGTSAQLNASLKNIGTTDINTAFYVALYQGDISGQLLQTKIISSLLADANTPLTFSDINTAGLAGSPQYTVVADFNSMVDENNETNNSEPEVLIIQGINRDLTVESAAFSPPSVAQGTAAQLNASIKNIGTTDINTAFYVALYQGSATGAPLQAKKVNSLLAGQSTALAFSDINTAGLEGSVQYTIVADFNSMADETNETNNQRTAQLTVIVAVNEAELNIASISFEQETVMRGTAGKLNVILRNSGDISSGEFFTALYKGSVATGALVGIRRSAYLMPGATDAVVFNVDINTLGTHTYAVFIDYNNVVSETIETNNQAQASLTVATEKPDLIIESLTANKTTALPGEQISLTFAVKNAGLSAVESDFNVEVEELVPGSSPNPIKSMLVSRSKTCTQDSTTVTASLCADDTNTFSVLVTTSSLYSVVDYVVYADLRNEVAEEDEANNSRTIRISLSEKPDLKLKRLDYPRAVQENSTADIALAAENTGITNASHFFIRLYKALQGAEITLGSDSVSSLAAGSDVQSLFQVAAAQSGVLELFLEIDSNNEVDESDEGNNKAGFSILVRGGEICGNAADDDNDMFIDMDDSDCREICTDATDNDGDGYVNEGCGEICFNGADDDLDGQIDEGCGGGLAEVCGNDLDNDQDGIVDEGCPFILLVPRNSDTDCISDADEILFGTNPEISDSDGDCIDDCQEMRYDHTDALDTNSNLIVLNMTKQVVLGDTATASAKHPILGTIKDSTMNVRWQHKIVSVNADEKGILSYKPLESGRYSTDVQLCRNHIVAGFTVISETTTMQSIVNFARSIFGSSLTDAPFLLILLIILCGLAAVITYRNGKYFFEYMAKSTEELRRERSRRAVMSIAAFVLPIVINRGLDINSAIILAFAETAVMLLIGYFKGSQWRIISGLSRK